MAHQYYVPPPANRDSTRFREPLSPIAHEEEPDFEQSIFIFPSPSTTSGARNGLHIRTDVGQYELETTTDLSSTTRRGRRLSSATENSAWELLSGRSTSVDTLHSPLVEVWEMTDEEDPAVNSAMQPSSVASTLRTETRSPRIARSSVDQPRYPLGKQPHPSTFTCVDGRYQLRRRVSYSRHRRRNESLSRCRAGGARRKSLSIPRSPAHPQPHRLPLLPILSALFGIEDATLGLLASPANTEAPTLFPGPRLHKTEDIQEEKRIKPLETSEVAMLRHGVDATIDSSLRSDNAFALPSLPFSSVWDLVSRLRNTPRKAQALAQ